jgi:hypothetical protein
MALLLTLVILMLLSIFMVEFSFQTTLETRGIRNFQASFKARNAVKSMLKAVLEGLQTRDEIAFFRQDLEFLQELNTLAGLENASILNPPSPTQLPQGILEDFEDIIFYSPVIRPIDHLFNMNRLLREGTPVPGNDYDLRLSSQFFQMVSHLPVTSVDGVLVEEGIPSFLTENQVMQLYGNIFDWLDSKDGEMPYTTPFSGSIGAEQLSYVNYGQEKIVKNRGLDHLIELRLTMGFRESGIPWESWERYFTTYPVGRPPEAGSPAGEARLNVNLASKEEIIEFLTRFDQDRLSSDLFESNTQEYVINAANIASVLKQQQETKGPLNLMVDAEYRQIGSIQSALDADPTTNYLPRQAEQKFFIRFSQWYQIRLKAEMDGVLSSVEAVVQVPRNDDGEPSKNGMIIHHFSLN